MSKTTIGVNLLWLVPGAVGGSEDSTLASLRALLHLDPPDLDLRLFVLAPFVEAHPDLVGAVPTEVLALSGRSRVVRVLRESTWLARRTNDMALLHNAGGTAPAWGAAPYVLTVHDLQPLERRASHSTVKRAYLAASVPRSIRGSQRVVVPSEFVRASVLARTKADPDDVVVIPHGVERHPDPSWPAVVRERYGLHGDIVLYPAIPYPHKNHAVLVEAFAQVAEQHPEAILVLPGGVGACDVDLSVQVARLGLTSRVRRLGRIPAADLAGLYLSASVVAVPSRYEGFGLPAAEAMAYGVPVVAADATALPEVVAGGGLVVDPDDVAGWAAMVGGLLSDEPLRLSWAEAGLRRAAAFSWAANATAMADVYRAALG